MVKFRWRNPSNCAYYAPNGTSLSSFRSVIISAELSLRTGALLNPANKWSDTETGIRSIIIYECDNNKLADALQVVGDRLANYFDVPGYTYSANAWYEAPEALKMIGLA